MSALTDLFEDHAYAIDDRSRACMIAPTIIPTSTRGKFPMFSARLSTLTAFAGAAILLAAVASTAANAQTKLRFGHDQPVGSMYDEGHQALKKIVAEKSAGKMQIDVFPAAQLGSEVALLEGLRL